ncbi:MAG: hypothetical protein CMJ20_07305 [Phycisphaeraceae bacterium]|nr:hypothetical protein [Phycisphaeraceae bacterium]
MRAIYHRWSMKAGCLIVGWKVLRVWASSIRVLNLESGRKWRFRYFKTFACEGAGAQYFG